MEQTRDSSGPIYAFMVLYNAILLITHGLFIIWNIDGRNSDSTHHDGGFSYVYLVVFITLTAVCSLLFFLSVQYYGRCVERRRHYSLRFYSVSVMIASCILYGWFMISVGFKFRERDTACVTIISLGYIWFCLAMYLYDIAVDFAIERRSFTTIRW